MVHHLLCRLPLTALPTLAGTAHAQTLSLHSAVAAQVDRVYPEMRSLGFIVTEGAGKTGVVAIYEECPQPTVMK